MSVGNSLLQQRVSWDLLGFSTLHKLHCSQRGEHFTVSNTEIKDEQTSLRPLMGCYVSAAKHTETIRRLCSYSTYFLEGETFRFYCCKGIRQ